MNFKQAQKTLFDTREQQIQLLKQMRDERPKYLSSLAWDVFGPPVRLADDGDYAELWAHVDWTEKAKEYIQNKEYQYCSIEVDLDHYNEKTGKHIGTAALAAAVTNRPFIKGMAPIELNSDGASSEMMLIMTGRWHHIFYGEFSITKVDLEEAVKNHPEIHRSANPESPHPPTEMVIDYNHGSLAWDAESAKAAGWVRGDSGLYVKTKSTKAVQPKQFTDSSKGLPIILNSTGGRKMSDAQVRRILGLSDDVSITDEHRQNAVVQLAAQEEASFKASQDEGETPETEGDPEAPEGDPETEGEETPQPDPVTASQVTTMQRELNDLKRKLAEKDVDEVLSKALSDGKITPVQKKKLKARALKSQEGFATVMEFIAEIPAKVFNTTELGEDNGENPAPNSEAAARAEFNANRDTYEKLGLTEEKFVRNYKHLG